jgi:cytochrome c-type biogenesis protein CcmH
MTLESLVERAASLKSVALLVVVLVTALALIASADASEERPTPADVEDEVLCPTCETTLDQSDSPIAQRMKTFIRARIAAGDTKSEIKAKLVDEFGERILASPPREGFNLLAWWLPFAGLGAGAVAVGLLAWRWSRARSSTDAEGSDPSAGREGSEPSTGPDPDPELERRLDEELARFEA